MKHSRTMALGVCALLVLLAGHSTAQTTDAPTIPTPLTLRQAIALARARNPTLLAAAQNLESTRAEEITASLRQNPVLGIGGSDVTLPANNPASPYSYSADVSRLFERGQKRRWRLDSARATTKVTESQYHDLERQTVLNVEQTFTNMLLAKGALELADKNLSSYRKTVHLSHFRLQAGAISQTDFERIDLQLASFESDYSNAQINLIQNGDQLQQLLGAAAPSRKFDIVGTLIPPALTASLPDLEQKALAARPDYLAAREQVQAAEANIKLANADGTTDPTLDAGYNRSGTYNSFGFNVSIPIRIFDRNQGEKQASRFNAQADRFSEIAARSQVLSDVDQAWAGYDSARGLAERYNTHYLAEAGHVLNNLQFGYRHGSTTLLDYLDALHDYRQTNLDALNANAQVWLNLEQLSFATATEIPPMNRLNLTLAAVVLAFCAAGCSSHDSSSAPPPAVQTIVQTVVQTVTVHQQKVIDRLNIPARVTANPTKVVQIFPPLSGRIVRFSVLPGQVVKAGQTIAVLQSGDIAQARSDFEKSKIQAILADAALNRGKLLLQHEVLAKADYEQLVAADDAAHSEQQRTLQVIHELGFSENNTSDEAPIYTPIAGVVLDTGTAVGEMQRSLDNATPLATVANLSQVWVVGDAYQNDLTSVQVGRPVTVTVPAYPGLSIAGKISNVSQSLDPNTLTVKVRVVVANPGLKLKPQMFATISIDRSQVEGFLIPSQAIIHENKADSVFVQTSPGQYERRGVKIGQMQQQNVVVLNGLHDGDQVVTLGAALLRAPAGE